MSPSEEIWDEVMSEIPPFSLPSQTIALPLETIEVLIQIADNSIRNRDRLGNASDREKTLLGEVAYAYMRKTGIWPDLKSVNPPKEIADIQAK